jgi:hypothetical protein
MPAHLCHRVAHVGRRLTQALRRRLAAATTPAPAPGVGTLADRAQQADPRGRERAAAPQPRILRWRVNRPRGAPADRALCVLLASRRRIWHQALLLVQLAAVLRWHGLTPAPQRRRAITWRAFLAWHRELLLACGVFTMNTRFVL